MTRSRKIFGWFAVGLSTLVACFWAYWGIIENFHEGWYHPSLGKNLAMMFVQYLMPMLVFVASGLVAIRWPRVGGAIHIAAGALAAWHFRGASPLVVYVSITGPLVLMGLAYGIGRPTPRRRAAIVLAGLPLLTLVVCGVEPVYRVSRRVDDGDRGARRVEANGVDLVWAPEGPGWPDHGLTWEEARRRCRHLTADGTRLADTPQDVWRLPTVDEVVRSSFRRGENAGGVWDPEQERAHFERRPDKEPPLWNPYSKIIYWWTATETDTASAYRVCYNGHVMPLEKRFAFGYLGFRAVRAPDAAPAAAE